MNRPVEMLELKSAIQILREYKRLEKTGSAKARTVYWVSKVYRAIHAIWPIIVTTTHAESVEGNHLRRVGAANHYYRMLNDMWCSISENRRFEIPSCISLELVQTSLRMHEKESKSNSLNIGTVIVGNSSNGINSTNFGKGHGTRTEPYVDLAYVPQYEVISKWMRQENHVNDMINVALAALMIHGGELGHPVEMELDFW